MYKSLFVIFVILLVTVSVQCGPAENLKIYRSVCRNDAGITSEIKDKNDPKLKQFRICVFTALGIMVNGKILPDIAWKRLKEIKPDIDESNREKITRCSGVANKLNTALDTVESILQGECTELLEFVTGLENLIEATICEIRQRFNSVSQSCIQDLGITSAVKDINDPIFGKARVCMLTRLGMIENGKIVSSVAYNRLNEIRPIDKSKREKLNKSAETANASSNIEEIATSFVRNGGEEIQIIDKLLQNREKDIPELKC